MKLYAHPFSSYCQKALTALYENGIDFEFAILEPETPENMAELEKLWPMKRFPVLVDGETTVIEASIIVEYLDIQHPGPVRMVPEDTRAELEVRFMDRIFDNYVAAPQMRIVFDALREEGKRDPHGVKDARAMLDTIYPWLETRLADRRWAAGDSFSLADCGAGPFLFYADWSHEIGPQFPRLRAYRQRLIERPAFARCIEEARPYRPLFPLGAPDRD